MSLNNLLHYIARRIQYKYIRIRLKLTSSKIELNSEQKAGIKIVKMLAYKPESEIMIAPISNKYYIKSGEIFIVIDVHQMTIINSIYHYDIINSDIVTQQITRFLRKVIERRREKMEILMRAKIQHSLSQIITDLQVKITNL